MLELAHYIVLNPVRACMMSQALDWQWRSYRATVRLTETPTFLRADWLLSAFGTAGREARLRFESFVADGISRPGPWQNLRNQVYLGSDRFVETVQQQIKDEQPLEEIPARQKRRPAHPLSYYADHYPNRNRAMAVAYVSGAYSMREIGTYFAPRRMTVSRAVKQFGSTSESAQQSDVQWETSYPYAILPKKRHVGALLLTCC